MSQAITKTSVTPYLMLSGKAREIMQHYQRTIGGELSMQTFGEVQGPGCPEAMRDQIMHAKLTFGDFVLMASDGVPSKEPIQGNTVHLAIGAPDAEIERLFTGLAEGGTVTEALFDAPWGGKFGALIDKYGFHWMFASSH